MSVKVLGCFGSHCSTARLADTYRAVALTGFIAVRSAGRQPQEIHGSVEASRFSDRL